MKENTYHANMTQTEWLMQRLSGVYILIVVTLFMRKKYKKTNF